MLIALIPHIWSKYFQQCIDGLCINENLSEISDKILLEVNALNPWIHMTEQWIIGQMSQSININKLWKFDVIIFEHRDEGMLTYKNWLKAPKMPIIKVLNKGKSVEKPISKLTISKRICHRLKQYLESDLSKIRTQSSIEKHFLTKQRWNLNLSLFKQKNWFPSSTQNLEGKTIAGFK